MTAPNLTAMNAIKRSAVTTYQSVSWSVVGSLGRWSGVVTLNPLESPQDAVLRTFSRNSGYHIISVVSAPKGKIIRVLHEGRHQQLKMIMQEPQELQPKAYLRW